MKTSFFSFSVLSHRLLQGRRIDGLNVKLLKNQLLTMCLLLMAIGFVSCSGEDGEMGPQGPQGVAGADGADGLDGADGINCWDLNGNGIGDITEDDSNEDINLDGVVDALDCQGMDGQDGVDGNANVKLYKYNLDVFIDYSQLILDMTGYIDDDLENYAYLFYMDHKSGLRYSIPGNLYNNNFYARVYTNLELGNLHVNFYDLNDDAAQVPGGEYTHLIMVAMELGNTAKNGGDPWAELKAAGVDTSDYNAVAAYFGLE